MKESHGGSRPRLSEGMVNQRGERTIERCATDRSPFHRVNRLSPLDDCTRVARRRFLQTGGAASRQRFLAAAQPRASAPPRLTVYSGWRIQPVDATVWL